MSDALRTIVVRLFGQVYERLTDIEIRLQQLESRAESFPLGYSRLRMSELIARHFGSEEIDGIAFNLGFDGESLPGATRAERSRALISYCERRDSVRELVAECQRQRPSVTWPRVPTEPTD